MPSIPYPEFAESAWYRNPSDPRCPHDAWLELLEIQESATGDRREIRKTEISLRLLDSYYQGTIIYRYSDVNGYEWSARDQNRGHGDFLSDCFEERDGLILHRIKWERSRLSILARMITYERKEGRA